MKKLKYKNYYEILGLTSAKVTENEIKTAYRKLAKKYHPDCNPGDSVAAENFKNVNEAYQVLSDSEARQKYNLKYYAHSFKNGFSIAHMKDWIDKAGVSEFTSMFLGQELLNVNRKQEKNKKSEEKRKKEMEKNNVEIFISLPLKEAFLGVQKKITFRSYDGTMKKLEVKIPEGIVDGGKIKIKGLGKSQEGQKTKGDLLIAVHLEEDSRFVLQGANLVTELLLTPSEAALGCQKQVEGLDGKKEIKIHAGMDSGEDLILKKEGYYDAEGNRGDWIFKTKIVAPKHVSKEEEELYKRLEELSKKKEERKS